MPKHGKRGSKKKSGSRPTVDVSGFLNRMGLPVPRLPFVIGSNRNLSATNAIYPRMVKLDFPIIPQFAGIAAGGVTFVLPVDLAATLVELAVTALTLFSEFAVVGFTFELRINNVVNPAGLYLAYVDEKIAAAPTAAMALQSPHIEGLVQQTESPSAHRISWKAADLLDLDWTSSTTSAADIPVWLKVFASAAATGTTATTTGTIQITGSIAVCFRGYAQ